jgi:hypothetical protein
MNPGIPQQLLHDRNYRQFQLRLECTRAETVTELDRRPADGPIVGDHTIDRGPEAHLVIFGL